MINGQGIPNEQVVTPEKKEKMLAHLRKKIQEAEIFCEGRETEFWQMLKKSMETREKQLYEDFLTTANPNVSIEREYAYFRVIQQKIQLLFSIKTSVEKSDEILENLKKQQKSIIEIKTKS